MMALAILYDIINLFLENLWDSLHDVRFWLALVIPLLPMLCGVYVVIKNLRSKGPKEVSALMTMQIVYLSNALLCLIMFFKEWQIGAYFVVVTSGVYLTQIVVVSVKLAVFQGRGANSIDYG